MRLDPDILHVENCRRACITLCHSAEELLLARDRSRRPHVRRRKSTCVDAFAGTSILVVASVADSACLFRDSICLFRDSICLFRGFGTALNYLLNKFHPVFAGAVG
jgi:hypothetical protein